jgi:hypothetical protein
MNIQNAQRIAEIMLEAAVAAGGDAKAPMESVILQNEIAHGELQLNEPVLIQLTNSEKTQNSDKWRTYREQNASFAKHRGQTHSLILRQRSQLLEDKMKQDADWTVVFQFPTIFWLCVNWSGKQFLLRQKISTRLPQQCATKNCRFAHFARRTWAIRSGANILTLKPILPEIKTGTWKIFFGTWHKQANEGAQIKHLCRVPVWCTSPVRAKKEKRCT